MTKQEIETRAKQNGISFDSQRLLEIHCLAENIIDEIEGIHNHNVFDSTKASEDYMLDKACEILDISQEESIAQ